MVNLMFHVHPIYSIFDQSMVCADGTLHLIYHAQFSHVSRGKNTIRVTTNVDIHLGPVRIYLLLIFEDVCRIKYASLEVHKTRISGILA